MKKRVYLHARDAFMHNPIDPTPEGLALGVTLRASIAWAAVCPPEGVNGIPESPLRANMTWVDHEDWGLPVIGSSNTAEETAWLEAVEALTQVIELPDRQRWDGVDRRTYAEERARHNYMFWAFELFREAEHAARRCARGEGVERSFMGELMDHYVCDGLITVDELVTEFLKLHHPMCPECTLTQEALVAHIQLYTHNVGDPGWVERER